MHLSQSEAAMKKKDMAGCIKHMEEAHKAIGRLSIPQVMPHG
jgi:hypothetical protein